MSARITRKMAETALRELADGRFTDPMGTKHELSVLQRTNREAIVLAAIRATEQPARPSAEALRKVIADLKWMRRQEAKGVMAMANDDASMFEDCIKRLDALAKGE